VPWSWPGQLKKYFREQGKKRGTNGNIHRSDGLEKIAQPEKINGRGGKRRAPGGGDNTLATKNRAGKPGNIGSAVKKKGGESLGREGRGVDAAAAALMKPPRARDPPRLHCGAHLTNRLSRDGKRSRQKRNPEQIQRRLARNETGVSQPKRRRKNAVKGRVSTRRR